MLNEDVCKRIDREVAKYPADQKQSAVMAALEIVQGERGWLSQESLAEVAAYLKVEVKAVREVATFYNMNEISPVDKLKLTE